MSFNISILEVFMTGKEKVLCMLHIVCVCFRRRSERRKHSEIKQLKNICFVVNQQTHSAYVKILQSHFTIKYYRPSVDLRPPAIEPTLSSSLSGSLDQSAE